MSLIYDSTSLVRLAVAEAMFLVVSFIYLLIRRKMIKGRIVCPVVVIEDGKTVNLKLMIRNRSRLLTGVIRCCIRYTDGLKVREKNIRLRVSGSGENEYLVPVTLKGSGRYEFVLGRCRVYDHFGFFSISKRFSSSVNVVVLPELKNVSVKLGERIRNFSGDSDVYDDLRPGRSSGEIFDIREFKAGDKIQKINWKLSAKRDMLLIREDSLPKACPLIVYYSFPGINEGKSMKEYMNEQLTNLASVSFSLMDRGCPHFAVWKSESRKSLIRVRVDDEESFFLALTESLRDSVYEDHDTMKEEYKEKYRGEIHAGDIWCEKGRLMLDDKEVPSRDGYIDIAIN